MSLNDRIYKEMKAKIKKIQRMRGKSENVKKCEEMQAAESEENDRGDEIHAPDDEFDIEGIQLLSKLNLKNTKQSPYSHSCMNCVYQLRCNNNDNGESSSGGDSFGRVYIGNMEAAKDINLLRKHNITSVVCCISKEGYNSEFWHESELSYYRFPVSRWYSIITGRNTYSFQSVRNEIQADISQGKAKNFFKPLFHWIDAAVSRGEGVLIHCLAGAHRAGTTGVAYVMHVSGSRFGESLAAVKKIRPIVAPYGHLVDLLKLYEQDMHP